MTYEPAHMKWWGWGHENAEFHATNHPNFWPYAKSVLDVEGDEFPRREWSPESIELPEPCTDGPFLAKLRGSLAASQITEDAKERVIHS